MLASSIQVNLCKYHSSTNYWEAYIKNLPQGKLQQGLPAVRRCNYRNSPMMDLLLLSEIDA